MASPVSTTHDRYAPSMTGSERERDHHQQQQQQQQMYSPHGGAPSLVQEDESPFGAITEDLRNRIIDWKGHPLAGLGPLQMFDLLSVRRDSLVREFFVYLFKEAIICVAEEKKRTLGRFLTGGASGAVGESTSPGVLAGGAQTGKGVLRLKGRIYIRHIKQVTDTSVQGELSLTIDMEDERLDSFILIFKERPSLETWKQNIQSLVTLVQRPPPPQPSAQTEAGLDMEEFGGSASGKAARMFSGSTGTTASTTDSLLNSSARSTVSSSTSHGSIGARNGGTMHHKLSTLDEDDGMGMGMGMSMGHYAQSPAVFQPHLSQGPSNSLTPVPHPPLDLILVISVPPPTALPSTAVLKIRVIKASLDFIIASLSVRDRLSLVTFEVGMGGKVRKTPFLSLGRTQSRARLAKFVDEIGVRMEDMVQMNMQGGEFEDEFLVRGSKEEKTDVVTAVNHGTSKLTHPLHSIPARRLNASFIVLILLLTVGFYSISVYRTRRRPATQIAKQHRRNGPRQRRRRQHPPRPNGPRPRPRRSRERPHPLLRLRPLSRPCLALAHVEPHLGHVHVRQGLVRPPRLSRGLCGGDDVDRVVEYEVAYEDCGWESV